MDRSRIRAEVIELLAAKPFFHKLPPIPANGDEGGFDYDDQRIKTLKKDDGTVEAEGLTANPLDLYESSMELEDAFSVSLEDKTIGDEELETIGEIVAFVHARINSKK